MVVSLIDSIVLVLCGGIFGWLLGRLPEKWVYGVMAFTALAVLVALNQ